MPKEHLLWAGYFPGPGNAGDTQTRLCLPGVMFRAVGGGEMTAPIRRRECNGRRGEGKRIEQTRLSGTNELDEEKWGRARVGGGAA